MSNLNDSPIKESNDKLITILRQSKGQLEASIQKVEPHLTIEEFKDYCDSIHTCLAYQDSIHTCLAYQDTIIKKLKDSE